MRTSPNTRAKGCDIERREHSAAPREAEAIFACDVVAGHTRNAVKAFRQIEPAIDAGRKCERSALGDMRERGCQCYDQWAVAPSGVQAAHEPLWVVSDLGGC
jgi:hypothetical protein